MKIANMVSDHGRIGTRHIVIPTTPIDRGEDFERTTIPRLVSSNSSSCLVGISLVGMNIDCLAAWISQAHNNSLLMTDQIIPQKRRLACDRCHSQKLRCPKTQGAVSCARCSKAGAPCEFSPSLRGSKPQIILPEVGRSRQSDLSRPLEIIG